MLSQEIIYFTSGYHKLNGENQNLLDSIIYKKSKKKNLKIFIDAHTDDVGSKNSNLTLSQ